VIEEGETSPINGGMKGIDAVIFLSSGGGVGVDPGGGALGSGAKGRRRWPVGP
jgi:hypothetical protein